MSGVSPVAISGTPQTATATREAVATRLQTMTLARMRRSPRPLRSTGSDRSSMACGQLPVANLEPREHRAAGLAEAQHALRRGHGLELVVRPFGRARCRQRRGSATRRARAPPSRRAVRWSRRRRRCLLPTSSSCVHIPPTLSASARPSPTGEAGCPAAVTCSSTARLEMSRDSTTHRQSPSLTVA